MTRDEASSVRAAVRAAVSDRILAVLDDDPTGSQSVRGVQVVTALDEDAYTAAISADSAATFVLTNTRGLHEENAAELTRRIATQLIAVAARAGRDLDLVSRSDSTLRGHVIAELRALDDARRAAVGSGFDAFLIAPAFFEAGRTTVGDIHRVRIDGTDVPAGDSEYARDKTFGYRSSDLKEFLAEKSGGAIAPSDVVSISLDDIRTSGPDHIAQRLSQLRGGRYVVINGESDEDFDIVALGVARARAAGAALLTRCGPSFVRALAGIEPGEPLLPREIWPNGQRPGHGLIVAGSHVSGTTRQLERLRERIPVHSVELDVAQVLADDTTRDAHVAQLAQEVTKALLNQTVLIATSRELVPGVDANSSLQIARRISDALTAVAGAALSARPAWVIAKGGITSHETAVTGFGVRRAEVAGQLGRGIISLFRPVDARADAIGMPYVVFAGNVGTPDSLADVVELLQSPVN
ncbi:MAG TPA: four-carbon acid sugar kinase family protein [Microbacterium sp.]|nr:four-carbon acid sugar kinase family protein [Microbacterium sp.]